MTKKELNKLRREIFSDKSITGVSFDPKSAMEWKPTIVLKRSVVKTYQPKDFESWDKLNQ